MSVSFLRGLPGRAKAIFDLLTTVDGKVDTVDGCVDSVLVDTTGMAPKVTTILADTTQLKSNVADLQSDVDDLPLPGQYTFVKNPGFLPRCSLSGDNLMMKTGSGSSNVHSSNVLSFWTQLGVMSAYADVAASDTYVTVADITGAGILTGLIGSEHADSGASQTFRVTLDGAVYTIVTNTATLANTRPVMGAILNVSSSAIGVDSCFDLGSSADLGWAGFNNTSNYPFNPMLTGGCLLPAPTQAWSRGMPCVFFEISMKIEMKISIYSPPEDGADYHTRCGAAYWLF